jgi:hypothetical protein
LISEAVTKVIELARNPAEPVKCVKGVSQGEGYP